MPAIRPEAVSNAIRLLNEVRAADRRLIAKNGAVDTVLASTLVDEDSPHEHGVAGCGAQYDLLSGASEAVAPSSIAIDRCAVVAQVQVEAREVAIFGQPPVRQVAPPSTRDSSAVCGAVVSLAASAH